ncbi:MAG: hypothetical protein M3387_05735 [Actinomycetota bacterium]|nr:hypothetical protein [Actinomycetota bacterium]
MTTAVATRGARVAKRGLPVWLPLGVVEARRLARHPVTLLGLALSLYALTWQFWGMLPVLQRDDASVGVSLLPLAAGTLLAAHIGTLRGHRHGTEELFASTGTAERSRTLAHLVAAAGPVGVTVVVVVGWLAAARVAGGVGTPNLAELAAGPAIVALGAVIGVTGARWLPHPLSGPLLLLALALVQAWPNLFGLGTDSAIAPVLSPWLMIDTPKAGAITDLRPASAHLLYLLGVVGLVGVAALARRGLRTQLVLSGALAVAVTVSGVAWQLRPPPSRAVRAAYALTIDAPSYQRCQEGPQAVICAYPGFTSLAARYRPVITGVADRVPGNHPPVRVRQLAAPPWVPEAADRLQFQASQRANRHPRHDGWIELAPGWGVAAGTAPFELGLGLQTAVTALGIPRGTSARSPFETCSTGGQARGVVALWLAAQASSGAAALLRQAATAPLVGYGQYDDQGGELTITDPVVAAYLSDEQVFIPNLERARELTPAFHRLDALYAVQLLDQAPADVAAALVPHWERWTGSSTPSDELADALGLVVHPPLDEALRAAGVAESTIRRVARRYASADDHGAYPLARHRPCR